MSLLRAPAATARLGGELPDPLGPKSPPVSTDRPPPPPRAPRAWSAVELKPCNTISVEYRSRPLWSVHLRVWSAPRCKPWRPSSDTARQPCRAPRRRSRRGATRSSPCAHRSPCRARSPTSRCSDWRSAARHVSAGFPDRAEIADENHLVHASRHRRSPLDAKNHWQKLLVGPASIRPPSILDLSPI